MREIIAETDRITLRDITVDDTDNIIRWRNSKHVMDNFIQRTPLTKEVHLDWLKNKVAKGFVRQFIITEKATGQDIGSVYFRDIDNEKKEGEFGIFIGEEDRLGHGYGVEVQELAVRFATEEMGLRRIKLRVLADNIPAIKTYEKCGFIVVPDEKMDVDIEGTIRTVIFMEAVY